MMQVMKRSWLFAAIWFGSELVQKVACVESHVQIDQEAVNESSSDYTLNNFTTRNRNERNIKALQKVQYEILTENSTVEIASDRRLNGVSNNRVRFYAIGDGPYGRGRRGTFAESLMGIDKSPEFMVHVGDLKSNEKNCTLEHIAFPAQVMREVLTIPSFVIPGDNDWWDCGDKRDDAWDVFATNYHGFDRHWPKPFNVRYQEGRPENWAFTYKGTLFLSLHVLSGEIRGQWDRWNPMVKDNVVWLTEQFTSYGSKVGAVVMFCHAFPDPKKYKDLYTAILTLTADYAKPVLYLQGDWHSFKVSRSRFPNPNILHVVLGSIGRKDNPTEVIVDAHAEIPFKLKRNMIPPRGGRGG